MGVCGRDFSYIHRKSMLNDKLWHKRQDLVGIAFRSHTKGREPGKESEKEYPIRSPRAFLI